MLNCLNPTVTGTKACQQHQSQWTTHLKHCTQSAYAGVRRMLHCAYEGLEWQQNPPTSNTQPHDQPQSVTQHKSYFSPAHFYCVETLCAPCGTVIA